MKAWSRKFRASVRALSPKQIALLCIVGLVLGVFPIPYCPTILCLLAAFGWRLNVGALQLLNTATSPLQWALWLPLERVGALVCGTAALPIPESLGAAALHAVLGWVCICIPLGVATYLLVARALTPAAPALMPALGPSTVSQSPDTMLQ
jgi:hypothetical protein